MAQSDSPNPQLAALATHLKARRPEILRAWQRAVAADPKLTTASTLSRTQFNDHIPDVLDGFERKLRAERVAEQAAAERDQQETAAEHGLMRWQQGYDQRETMLEWGHLQLCILDELEAHAAAHPEIDAALMVTARRELALLCGEGVSESAARYTRMQQSDAAGRVAALERGLEELNQLQQQRAEVWREATHDLRGSVGVISNASMVLEREGVPEAIRIRVSQMVQRGLLSLADLLNDLTVLARLEAGQERREVAPFDAARLIADLCSTSEPLAVDQGLFLRVEGPPSIAVEGDAVKTQRIAQNLLLNALKYTVRGGVKVTWDEDAGGERWVLCVQDTGPGFDRGRVPPIARALKQATDESHQVEETAAASGMDGEAEPAPTLASQSPPRAAGAGEGIGLSIVKRLCELLDATLELETSAGQGTTFRVVFPRRYAPA